MYGYTVKNDTKVYDMLSHKTVYLVISNETAFSIAFLYETTLHFLHNNATFLGLSDIYNQFHNYKSHNITRNNLNEKRLASGFFLYGFLEFSNRYKIQPELNTCKNWLDEALVENQPKLKKIFANIWSGKHECAFEDCESMMITDGNMKLTRKVCAAKFSVVRKFEHSNKTVLTGCTAMPSPDSPFCAKHVHTESPVLLRENVTKTTRSKLSNYRAKNQASNLKLPEDSVFVVESVLDARKNGNDAEYLVKFSGYPRTEACWEPMKNLPHFVIDFYGDKSKYGLPLPSPTITETVKVDEASEVFHHLDWKISSIGNKNLEIEDGSSIFDLNQDKLSEDEIKSSCNTRKVKDKRDRRHTAGIIIHAKPCGKIPHVDELFNCESISQVYGNVIEYLGNLEPEERIKIKIWLFDDMCHLKPHAEKGKQARQNEITENFAKIAKAVDRFHFPGHKKSDQYCQENCNPNIELEKLGINKQNTSACEQAFSWLNNFKNLKTMNEGRFKMFLMYMIDLHNHRLQNTLQVAANPLNDDRESFNMKHVDKIDEYSSASTANNVVDENLKGLINDMAIKINIDVCEDKLEDCYTVKQSGELSCNYCPGTYKREGHMRNHLESKHNKTFKLICSCGKLFSDATRFSRHKKSCKS